MTTVHQPFDVRIFHRECVALRTLGYQVFLICCYGKDEEREGIQILGLGERKGLLSRFFIKPMYLLFRAFRLKADLYHFHDPELIPYMFLLKVISRKPIIFDIHENIEAQNSYRTHFSNFLSRILMKTYIILQKILVNHFRIVTVVEEIAEKYKGAIVVKNFCSKAILSYDLPIETNNYFSSDALKLIYIGGVGAERGDETMIRSVHALKASYGLKAYLTIIGLTNEQRKLVLKKLVKKLDLSEQIFLLDHRPYSTALSYVRASDIGLCLLKKNDNYTNSIATKLFEYMAFSKPVICSDFPCWREYILYKPCGIMVDPDNTDKICKAIKKIYQNPDLYKLYGKNGYNNFITKYNWESEFKKMEALYQQILTDGKGKK